MSKLVRDFPMLGSSVNPEKLSLTIKGILTTVASVLAMWGVVLPLADISPLIDQFGVIVSQIITVVGLITAFAGGVRKFINKVVK